MYRRKHAVTNARAALCIKTGILAGRYVLKRKKEQARLAVARCGALWCLSDDLFFTIRTRFGSTDKH